jgi:hypothetical protein
MGARAAITAASVIAEIRLDLACGFWKLHRSRGSTAWPPLNRLLDW